ncbi:pectate lyase [Lactobacillus sp. Sy-1]|nr:pectate lyase [Lactobacillus sp. Sy-1]
MDNKDSKINKNTKNNKTHQSKNSSSNNSTPTSQTTPTVTTSGAVGYGSKATGGTGATTANTFHVSTLQDLRSALSSKISGPRIVYIEGNIDGNNGNTAASYARETGYDLNSYLNAYNPSTYGKNKPSGTQEQARQKAEDNQGKNVKVDVPSNTTIIGAKGVTLSNVNFMVESNNVILQNLHMIAPVDYFPQWDPTDGSTGNWNSQYDAVSLKGATNVWLNHNHFEDGTTSDANAATYYGRQYQQHDGLVDITDGSDYVTANYNIFADHDKTMLIGSSDSDTSDSGKLHVTIADNYFLNDIQRMPRVRYGVVDVVNNYYQNNGDTAYKFSYAIGSGHQSTILARNNVVDSSGVSNSHLVENDGGNNITSVGNVFNGTTLSTTNGNDSAVNDNVTAISADQVKANVLNNSGNDK